jgi:G:T-mismatch repair DNA endonuclease (very short patch repair protein)
MPASATGMVIFSSGSLWFKDKKIALFFVPAPEIFYWDS